MKHCYFFWIGLLSTLCLISCSSAKKAIENEPIKIKELKFLSEYVIPYNLQYKGTTVGGLSGIDYDSKKDQYYLICDDRSQINPARFYTAKLKLTAGVIDTAYFINVTTLLMHNGNPYPNTQTDAYHTPDTEALRYFPGKKRFLVSSEGERIVKDRKIVLQDPFLHYINANGEILDSFALPAQMHMHAIEKGLRQNGVFEGLDFADNDRLLYVSVEEPLYEDGPRAGVHNSAWTRIIKYAVASRTPIAQYGCKIDPVVYPAKEAGGFVINGVSDILSIAKDQLLVIERSYSKGRPGNTIRVYLADLAAATNVQSFSSLLNTTFQPIAKKLLINMDVLNRHIDNVEGVCFGPRLPNGHRTLVFVTDNNFDKSQETQILLFEIIPG